MKSPGDFLTPVGQASSTDAWGMPVATPTATSLANTPSQVCIEDVIKIVWFLLAQSMRFFWGDLKKKERKKILLRLEVFKIRLCSNSRNL